MINDRDVHILIVEDSKADLFLIKSILSSNFSGKLDTVQDGEQALSYLNKENDYENSETPNLIILDLNLPKISGKELLIKLKANKCFSFIPIVIFSSSRSRSDIEECYSLGANCYLVKPFALDEYENAVNSIKKYWIDTVILPQQYN